MFKPLAAIAAGLTLALGSGVSTAQAVAPPQAPTVHLAATPVSSKWLLNHLSVKGEHTKGYSRSKFPDWYDADHDGCNTRYEVLIAEATKKPKVKAGCKLSGGKWYSRYDGVTTKNPSTFDIDHLVPLAEAWQSGAWKWSASKRKLYANDLGYFADLIAVSASSNRSKGDREPQDWMPPRTHYACTYLKQWVAVKWRWGLSANAREVDYLRDRLRSCGWPTIKKPKRAT